MAVYVISDIHAEYDLFIKLLDKIKFSDNDTLYIAGDIIDKGNDSVRLMQYVMNTPNIHAINGNHEHDFLKLYWALMQNSPNDYDEVLRQLQEYFLFDGYLLNWETVDYIESLPYYIETEDFILVHAGLPIDENNQVMSPSKIAIEYMVYDRRFKEPDVLPNTCKPIIFGHTPTSYICGSPRILKYKKQGTTGNNIKDYCKIQLDLGTWLSSSVMGALCVDTLEEFYVDKWSNI